MMRRICLSLFVLTATACHDSSEDCSLTDTCPGDAVVIPPGGAGGDDGEGGSAGQEAAGAGGTSGDTGGGATGGAATGGQGAGGDATGGEAGSAATGGGGGAPGGGAPAAGASGAGGRGGAAGQGGQAGAATAGAGGEGGQAGAGGQGGAPGCDPLLLPDADACVVTEQLGVFADPGAPAGGDGSRAAPFSSLAAALAAAAGKRVYACATHGPFAESLTIDADGASVFGGFECEGWGHVPGSRTALHGGATALVVAAADVRLFDLAVQAEGGAAPGESSVALFARRADRLALTRVDLVAGPGADGAPGTPGSDPALAFAFPDGALLAGGNATATLQGPGCPTSGEALTCPGGGSPGRGGDGGRRASSGEDGQPGEPTSMSGGQGGTVAECLADTNGHAGAVGAGAVDGEGAASLGTLDDAGWTPAAGSDGLPGQPGQGGGGGASVDTTGGGGGGGCGGCGGAPARAGAGGGASIALLSLESAVSLTDCTLRAADGGRGGDAADGQPGQSGGLRGDGAGLACDGGNGGAGQRGGAAGAGAGGLSAGILHAGDAPLADGATLGSITVGQPGAPGAPAAGKPLTAALPGLAEALLALP